MTQEEIKNKINSIETRIFYIEMIDHWSREDSEEISKLKDEKRKLLSMLEE